MVQNKRTKQKSKNLKSMIQPSEKPEEDIDVKTRAKAGHDYEIIGRILEILKILQERTDECTSLSQKEIYDLLKKTDHPCSERSLVDYLQVLMRELNPEDADGYVDARFSKADYKIIVKGLDEKLKARDEGLEEDGAKKLQLRNIRYNQLFSFEELNQVIEAVLFLKNTSADQKEKLIRKLQTLSSVNYAKHSPFISETTGCISKNISGVFEDSRIDEKVVKKNLNIIREAMEANEGRGYKISFCFNGYDKDKQLVLRKNGAGDPIRYISNPYYVILYNGKYYLICNIEPYENVAFYRIDLMSDVAVHIKRSLVDSQRFVRAIRKQKRNIQGLPKEWEDRSAAAFQSEHLYMFYGEPCEIRLKIDRERYTLLHDYFGEHYTFIKHIDEIWDEVKVTCVPKAMEAWAMQCSAYVEVLSPENVRANIANTCEQLLERYKRKI